MQAASVLFWQPYERAVEEYPHAGDSLISMRKVRIQEKSKNRECLCSNTPACMPAIVVCFRSLPKRLESDPLSCYAHLGHKTGLRQYEDRHAIRIVPGLAGTGSHGNRR